MSTTAAEFHADASQATETIEHLITETQQIEGLILETKPRTTGVIFAVPLDMTAQMAMDLRVQLEQRFPGVVIAVAPGSSSIAFEWEEPEDES